VDQRPLSERHGSAAFSLVCLFQIVTACCIFFACLRISPLLAIIGTLVSAPAIIRTGLVSELYRKNRLPFCWQTRLYCFAESVSVVLLTYATCATVFAAVSLVFGAGWVCVAWALGSSDRLFDIAFVGTAGGTIWGLLGAMLAFGFCASKWKPTAKVDGKLLV